MNETNQNKVLKTASVVMVVTVVAKLIGFLREAIIGYYYGANGLTDIFYTANGFTTGVIFAMTGSISVAFIPIYARSKKENNKTYLWGCICLLVSLALIVTLLFEAFAPQIASFLAPSYDSNKIQILQYYLRLFSIGIVFSLLANLFLSTLNAEGRFGYVALSGLIYSGISIVFILIFNRWIGVLALVYSIITAYVVQCAVLFVKCKRYVIVGRIKEIKKEYLIELLIASVPVLISNTTVEINHMVDRILASGLEEGAVSALSYSNTLFNLVYQIICNTFITIGFTEITNYAVQKKNKEIIYAIKRYVSIICMLVVPITVITSLYGTDIVRIAFKRGSFDENAVFLTGTAISIYAISFVLAGMYMLLNKVYYSLDNYKSPTKYGLISVGVNIILSIVFSKIWGLRGIVWATVLANLVLTVFLFIGIYQKYGFTFDSAFIRELIQYFIAGTCVYICLVLIAKRIFVNHSSVVQFTIATAIGMSIYYTILLILHNNRVREVYALLQHKLMRK